MRKFTVTTTEDFEADTAEEAALLMYQRLSRQPAPLQFAVADGTGIAATVLLEQHEADAFAEIDHTADPGNW